MTTAEFLRSDVVAARPRFGWSRQALSRALILAVVSLMLFVLPGTGDFTRQALSDAFLQVTVYVGATLFVVFALERAFSADLGQIMGRAGYLQSFYAALLGATPGCGGAIIVVTQFTKGKLTFGALVSVLISTMGDAAFLLIAREPLTAVLVVAISLVAGTVSGWIVDALHGPDFLRPAARDQDETCDVLRQPASARLLDRVWLALVALSLPISIALSSQVDVNAWFGALGGADPVGTIGVAGALLSLFIWALKPFWAGKQTCESCQPLTRRIADDTSFVTAWVMLAFLAYAALVEIFGTDIGVFFQTYRIFMPLVGVLVGLIPGCGPQIVVTTLYLTGVVPLSAQFANSISNDGDALFPAIALAPRAALMATLYSSIPALIVGYAWMFAFE